MSTADETEGTTDSASADSSGTDAAPPARAARPGSGSAQGGTALVFDDPLDRPSSDDTDRGWGDGPSDSSDDDFKRFLNEKPPHHL